MEGVWITPDVDIHDIGSMEHVDYAMGMGWGDYTDEEPDPEEDTEAYYDWTLRQLRNLYNNAYTRARYYQPRKGDPGDLVFSGHQRFITPEVVEYVLEHLKLPKQHPFTIDTADGLTLLNRGTLNDWLFKYDKRIKPIDPMEVFQSRAGLLGVKPINKETQQRIIDAIQGVGRG